MFVFQDPNLRKGGGEGACGSLRLSMVPDTPHILWVHGAQWSDLGGVAARCTHGAAPFRCFWRFYPVKRPTANHFGRCSQMLVDGRQRPLDDTWCKSKLCTVHARCAHGARNTLLIPAGARQGNNHQSMARLLGWGTPLVPNPHPVVNDTEKSQGLRLDKWGQGAYTTGHRVLLQHATAHREQHS